MINISLQQEYILSVFGLNITNTFFTSVLVSAVLILLSVFVCFKKDSNRSRLVNGMKILVFELLKMVDMVTGDRKLSKKILPLIATFFIFIITANLVSLIPGFLGSFLINTESGPISILKSPNSDLTTTLALALFSVFFIQIFSLKELGVGRYLGRFFNFTSPIKFILGFFEILSESVKILSFSFRLFGNIFAGEVLLIIIAFLVPYIIPVPFMILEVFVGIIQAFIFSMLTLVFIKTSIVKHMV